ncbi:MAG: hypothetical protein WBA74_26975, partial [Cyclobacteriaceae bacterium]
TYYGFGDLQYYYYIKSLDLLIHLDSGLTLNEKGIQAIDGKFDRMTFITLDLPMGGTSCNRYYRMGTVLKPAKIKA